MICSLKTGPWAGMFSESMFAVLGFGVQEFTQRFRMKVLSLHVLQAGHSFQEINT